jgi:ABC-type lipoprotein release transport system permease subunit
MQTMSVQMTESVMKKDILTNVGNLTQNLMGSVANAFDVDPNKIAKAFKFDLSEEELERIMKAMMKSNEKKSSVSNLSQLGYQDLDEPTNLSFYFRDFDAKERFLEFIDEYNETAEAKKEDDKVIRYTDLTGILMSSVKTIVNSVTYVLIAFVSISLIVSSIMIGIITYISVFERTKEIGILRAIGASKGNISSIFNAETFIIGLLSGAFGIGVTVSLIPIINYVIHEVTGNFDINAVLPLISGILLVILSVVLTIIGGLIPAKSASKKDPVVALRTE